MPRRRHAPDVTWLYPHASREEIAELKTFFDHFATRPRNWHDQTRKETHAVTLVNKDRIPWFSVPEQFRPRVQAWFDMKVNQVIREKGSITPGKIRSLRMNACHFGRNVLTHRTWALRRAYLKKRAKWLQYQEWLCQQEIQQLHKAEPMPRRYLGVA